MWTLQENQVYQEVQKLHPGQKDLGHQEVHVSPKSSKSQTCDQALSIQDPGLFLLRNIIWGYHWIKYAHSSALTKKPIVDHRA